MTFSRLLCADRVSGHVTGHSLHLMRDPLSTWDNLDFSYYVLLSSDRGKGDVVQRSYSLKFGRRVSTSSVMW